MAYHMSKKAVRDAELIAEWRTHDDAQFAKVGMSRAELEELLTDFNGEIIMPWSPRYNAERRLYNPVFDPFPPAIFICKTRADAQTIVRATTRGIPRPFTVRSGGHCTAGFSAGGSFLIDVSHLNGVTIDMDAMTATVGCGCEMQAFIREMDLYGVHVPVGECDNVCVGGFMQGGGYGFTSCIYGMNSDNVRSVEVALGNGVIVTANRQTNSDLFWAVRGGTGGNFGIVLSVTYNLVNVGKFYGWSVVWPLATATDRANAANALLLFQRNFMRTAPAGFSSQVSFCFQPSDPSGGGGPLTPWLLVRGAYNGPANNPQHVIQPLIDLPGAIFQYGIVGTFRYLNDKVLLSKPYPVPIIPNPMPNEDKQAFYIARNLTLAEYRSILDWFVTAPDTWSYAYFEVYGGAINAYPVEDSAFIHRDVAFSACLDVFWQTEAQRPAAEQFLSQWVDLMTPLSNKRVYQNYPSLAVPDYRAAYWGPALDALIAVKAKYDPQNFFNFAQMVSPYPGRKPVRPTWPPAVVTALQQPIVYASVGMAEPAAPKKRGFIRWLQGH